MSDVLKYLLADHCSVVVRPSGTEPKLNTYILVSAPDHAFVAALEERRLLGNWEHSSKKETGNPIRHGLE